MTDQGDVLQIVNETATLEKRDRVTGRVRVSTRTGFAEEIVSANLGRSDVEVTRVAVNRDIEAVPSIRSEGDVTIIPVVEEVLVVETRLVLREEIHIRRTTATQSVQLPVMLRQQHAVIERDDVPDNSSEEDTGK